MAKAAKKKEEALIEIIELRQATLTCHLVGTSPLLMNRFSFKARQQLLLPRAGRMTEADKLLNLKHDPVTEFRQSIYMNRELNRPAACHVPGPAFRSAIASVATDMPGAAKAKIERLTSVAPQVDLFGIPQLHMAMVRNSDMAHTPDVRTRAIFQEWACSIQVGYIANLLKQGHIANLVAGSGLIIGVCDYRNQKGGVYGGWRLCAADDPDYRRIVKTQGRVAQLKAIEQAVPYDAETDELLAWYFAEVKRREQEPPSTPKGKRRAALVPKLESEVSGNGQAN
jgi:hypothetical protein